jgi:hypothetical protein
MMKGYIMGCKQRGLGTWARARYGCLSNPPRACLSICSSLCLSILLLLLLLLLLRLRCAS